MNSFGTSLCLSQNVAPNAVLRHAVPTCVCVGVGCSCDSVMSTTCVVSCCCTLVKLYHTLCTLLVAIVPHTVHAYPHSPTRGSSSVCSPLNLLLEWVYVCMVVLFTYILYVHIQYCSRPLCCMCVLLWWDLIHICM